MGSIRPRLHDGCECFMTGYLKPGSPERGVKVEFLILIDRL